MPSTQGSARATTDTLSRRLRFSKPNPLVRRLVLTEADYLIFEAIDRHGPLPTRYLYEFTRHLRKDFSHLQNRLTEFYNGDTTGGKAGPYLTRPPQQFANYEARYQHLVYTLAPRASLALAERGIAPGTVRRDNGHFVHQLMSACIGASFELAASAAGLRYIPREEILARPDCRATRASGMPLAIPLEGRSRKTLVPDDIFGLAYPEGGYRFFAVECDRATESIERMAARGGAFSDKLAAYRQILAARRYRDWWGIPNLTVLTVTTNPSRAAKLVRCTADLDTHAERFAFAVEPSFGANWRVPKVVFSHLLDAPWATACGERHYGKP